MGSDESRHIVFRTVASTQVGLGHLRRCLTLADELKRRGLTSRLWIEGDAAARTLANEAGFEVEAISGNEPEATLRKVALGPIAALVADSYSLTSTFFRTLRPELGCLLAIDDLADRELDVDIVNNGSANATDLSYATGKATRLLLGPKYVLLRPVFRDMPARNHRPSVERVLLTMGGADPAQMTAKMVKQLMASLPDAILDVVVGPLFSETESLEGLAAENPRVRLHHVPTDLSGLMTAADLAVTAGGQTLYELAACGLPAVAVCLAENQRGQLAAMARLGTLVDGGTRQADGTFPQVGPQAARLAADQDLRQRMSATARSLVDGRGTIRVADALVEHLQLI